jgi:hypothetical protein
MLEGVDIRVHFSIQLLRHLNIELRDRNIDILSLCRSSAIFCGPLAFIEGTQRSVKADSFNYRGTLY